MTHDAPATAQVSDVVLGARLRKIPHIGSNSYLVALAAWQRGLQVSFHYSFAHQEARFRHLPVSGERGELLVIRHGKRRHAFHRGLGDRIDAAASRLTRHKPATLATWQAAGLPTPQGVVVAPGERQAAEALLEQGGNCFVLKPLDGSLGAGVEGRLTQAQVLSRLSTLDQPMLLEPFIQGTEYRVYVVDGQVVSAYIRRPACVVGDGQHSIAALVEHKAALRRQHRYYRQEPFALDAATSDHLRAQGWRVDAVPRAGEVVFLSDIPSLHHGGDFIDGMPTLSPTARATAEQAATELGVVFAGIDLIETAPAASGGMARAVLLEANVNPLLELSALPMPGVFDTGHNRVAEALIDAYFPDSRGYPRLTAASFDMLPICDALSHGQLDHVTLPTLGRDWCHRRSVLPAAKADEAQVQQLGQQLRQQGVHASWIRRQTGDVLADMLMPSAVWPRIKALFPDWARHLAPSDPPARAAQQDATR